MTRKLRVLMVSDVYFPRINGVSTSIETFRARLAEKNVDIQLLAPAYPGDHPTPDWVSRVASRGVPRDPEDRMMRYRQVLAAAGQMGLFDLVHIQTPFVAQYAGVKLARQWRVPCLATYHTLFEEYLHHYVPLLPTPAMRGLARKFSRDQCNALNCVIVPSQAMHDRLRDYGVTQPIRVLPTGIPLQRFSAGDGPAFRRRHHIPEHRPMALFVGRVAHEKNIAFLLEAMHSARKRLPDILLVITGAGPALPALQRQVQSQGLSEHVQFLGYLDRHHDLPSCYAAADVFAFASRTETQGLVLLEAMAMGVPVVALSIMGTRDILAPERGAVIAPDNPSAFGTVLADVLLQKGRRQRLAEEARVYAQEWSDEAMAGRLAQLYDQLAGTA